VTETTPSTAAVPTAGPAHSTAVADAVTRLPANALGMMSAAVAGAGGIARDALQESIRRVAHLGVEMLDLVPIDEIIDRIPIEKLVARIPIEELLTRIDFDALLVQIDLEALLARLDIGGIVNDALKGIDFEEVIHASTVGVGSEVRDVARDRAMAADLVVARVIDRIVRRRRRNLDIGHGEIGGGGLGALTPA
jgi:hypothetical protein